LSLYLTISRLGIENDRVDARSGEKPPMLYEAVISVLSIPMIPDFPELLSVSLIAGHNTLQGTANTSLCVLANAGAAIADSRVKSINAS
jgi:hypothetical protein